MQPGASADVYSLPPSIIKELAFIFAHNYMHRDGSNSPALSPSGAGPSLPYRAEPVQGSSCLSSPSRGQASVPAVLSAQTPPPTLHWLAPT